MTGAVRVGLRGATSPGDCNEGGQTTACVEASQPAMQCCSAGVAQ